MFLLIETEDGGTCFFLLPIVKPCAPPFGDFLKLVWIESTYFIMFSSLIRMTCKMDNVKCYNLRSIQIKDIESRCLKVCNNIKLEKF